LLIGENVSGTDHPLILRAQEHELPWEELCGLLAQIEIACRAFDCAKVRESLLQVVDGYKPSGGIEDYVWRKSASCSI
jgi:FlaA1/EpsC-like NDP-sugar epimerase